MKKLDVFSRFEDNIYKIWGILSIFVFPVIVSIVIDSIFLKTTEWFIRYPILFISWIVVFLFCFVFGITIGSVLQDAFNFVRKIFGKKPLGKIKSEQREKLAEEIYKAEEREEERFMNLSQDRKLYWLWDRQKRDSDSLRIGIETLRMLLKWVLVLLVILLVIIARKII